MSTRKARYICRYCGEELGDESADVRVPAFVHVFRRHPDAVEAFVDFFVDKVVEDD